MGKHKRQKFEFYVNEMLWRHDIMLPNKGLTFDANITPSFFALSSEIGSVQAVMILTPIPFHLIDKCRNRLQA